ncbi:MAG: MoxR family ATPase [Acidobacteria bacterium]|nr:MoxR family ATPase [Acidobacteriota bacterium]MCI0627865.1 MoxR family ATPase [Acidobacteriota bacterium]MCI0723488.1 MoxR family ATPase [Acidobacteriota bacterium]
MFSSKQNLGERLAVARYVIDPELLEVVYLAGQMKKPLLVEGPADSGKTELAYALAKAAETHVERLQCYEGIDGAAAIGSFDQGLQRLFLETQNVNSKPDWPSVRQALHTLEFFVAGPLLRALLCEEQPCVLLIDELDKVDSAFEALLLEVLSAWQFSIPKLGTIRARTIPFVVLTSNEERRIGDPLRRRSFYVRFEYPSTEREIQILACRASDCRLEVRRHTAAFARALRSLSLSKPPSISEILEMAEVMEMLGITEVAPVLRNVLLPVLVKTESDRRLLLIDDQWESLIYDTKKYLEERLVMEREQCCVSARFHG